MFRTLASILVLVLAGTPAASTACEVWCDNAANAGHHLVGCHEAPAATAAARHITTMASCLDAATAVYVSESRPAADAPVAAAIPRLATLADLNGRQAFPSWTTFDSLIRPPATRHSVLRI